VFKEFLTSLAKEVFDSDRGLWLSTNQHELYPNPHSYATDSTKILSTSLVLT
jgi:ubiquitin-protein ligase E3 C